MFKLWRCTQLLYVARTASSFSTSLNRQLSLVRSASSLSAASSPLNFGSSFEPISGYNSTVFIGRKSSLEKILPDLIEPLGINLEKPILNALTKGLSTKTGGTATTLVTSGTEDAHKVSVGGLPSELSRNNHPMSVHSLTKLASACKGNARIVVLTDDNPIGPLALAIAKSFPLFSKKSKAPKERNVNVVFCKSDGTLVDGEQELKAATAAAASVQLAARLVDSDPEQLTTTEFYKEVERMIAGQPIQMTQLVGSELRKHGGLYGVGKAAVCPPRMILLEYDGSDGENDETVALVGKGIVFDTGGLSLKSRAGMCGMKHDM